MATFTRNTPMSEKAMREAELAKRLGIRTPLKVDAIAKVSAEDLTAKGFKFSTLSPTVMGGAALGLAALVYWFKFRKPSALGCACR